MIDYLRKFFLKNKTAFVCGGAGLIGAEVSKALAQAKARVVILDVDRTKGKQLEKELVRQGLDACFVYFDISRLEKIGKELKLLIKKYKSVDVWVNASYPRTADWGKSDLQGTKLNTLRKNVDIQLNSVIVASQVIAQAMIKQKKAGAIINFGSIYGVKGNDFTIYEGTSIKSPMAYSAIKGGTVNLGRYLASYLGKYNIRVNTVCPGGVFDHQDKKFVRNYERKVPLKRMGTSEEMASAVLFLASDASSYITGTTLMVDGGWTIV